MRTICRACSPACCEPSIDQELHDVRRGASRTSRRASSTCNAATARYDIGKAHYDLGNDLFHAMLGQRLVYSCGYWPRRDNLDAAQEAKLDLVCRKLALEPGMRVLDIGCGWGEALKYAAERYGVSGVGITVSQQQAAITRADTVRRPADRDPPAGLPRRSTNTSIAVYLASACSSTSAARTTARTSKSRSAACGTTASSLLHCIGNEQRPGATGPVDREIHLPELDGPGRRQVTARREGLFVVEDWHNFGADYDRTLMAWLANFDRGLAQLASAYDERFRRMWTLLPGRFRRRVSQSPQPTVATGTERTRRARRLSGTTLKPAARRPHSCLDQVYGKSTLETLTIRVGIHRRQARHGCSRKWMK